MSPNSDRDEQVSRLAVYESVRDAARERALVTAAVLGALDHLSAGPGPQMEPPWADLFGDTDEAQTQLVTSEAIYRGAAAAIARPVAQSLVLFLG